MSDEQDLIDLENAQEASGFGSFEPVPPGEYVAVFNATDLTQTRNGHPQVVGMWTLMEPPYAGRTIRDWIVFAPKSASFLKLRFRALGVPLPGRRWGRAPSPSTLPSGRRAERPRSWSASERPRPVGK